MSSEQNWSESGTNSQVRTTAKPDNRLFEKSSNTTEKKESGYEHAGQPKYELLRVSKSEGILCT